MICQSVCVILNRDGRPSGDAIAEFATEEELEEAMKKDRENLGSRFIVLTRERDVGSQPRWELLGSVFFSTSTTISKHLKKKGCSLGTTSSTGLQRKAALPNPLPLTT